MAKQTINIGTVAGDGTGDPLRTALDKVNDNFDEVYAADVTAAAHIASTSNPHSVTKTQVGLGNCDNTSDANKPISTATQTALDLKAPLASPALTGTPTAPTAAGATSTTQLATTAFVQQELNSLLAGAPAALNTLNELAAAVNNDASFAATVTTALSGKAAITHTHAQSDIADLVNDLSGKAASSHTHALSALTQSGATSGQVAAWNGSEWAPLTPGVISTPKVCYVQTNGNNGTAVVGNPALPFATSQSAFDAGVALAAPFGIHFGSGTHGSIAVAADMAHVCGLTGEGFGVSIFGGITANGDNGAAAPVDDTPGGAGVAGRALLFDSDGSVDVSSIATNGGTGGAGGGGTTGGDGGAGGSNGSMRLRGVRGSGSCTSNGGGGGAGGGGSGIAGYPGGGSPVTLLGCLFGETVEIGGGSGAAAATVRVTRCTSGGSTTVLADAGYVSGCHASSFSVTGPAVAGNTTGANAHLLG